jgi:hypothetical protein
MYAVLEEMLKSSDDQRRRHGDFEGTCDELWPLRDRVLCRLAMMDQYEDALVKAKLAAAFLD